MDKAEERKTEAMEVIEFEISNNANKEKYAFDIKYIDEVFRYKKVALLPCTPSFIIGIINFRGKILSVIDIRNFIGFTSDAKNFNEVRQVIVVKVNEFEVGIAVDNILGYYSISSEEIQQTVLTITNERKEFFIGIAQNNTMVLDIKNIMLSEKIIVNDSVF
jgi:purine-binding chemotaxis protein CheW